MSKESAAPGISLRADWRDPENYKPLLHLDRPGWAGEFLRRNSAFLAATAQSSSNKALLIPSSAKRKPTSSRQRYIHIAEARTRARWGALFRRRVRFRDLLVTRVQPARAQRRGNAHGGRSRRRLRHRAV